MSTIILKYGNIVIFHKIQSVPCANMAYGVLCLDTNFWKQMNNMKQQMWSESWAICVDV